MSGSTLPLPAGWRGHHLRELRWQVEAWRLLVDPVYLGRGVPRGDGRPVLLLPGFLAGDYTLAVMGDWLRRIGYRPATAGIVSNVDCSARALARVEAAIDRAHAESGRRVAIVGHSRGGHLARAAVTRRPDAVSHVVSLGAALVRPFDVSTPTLAAVSAVRGVHRRLSPDRRDCLTDRCDCTFTRAFTAPVPAGVRLTSIYSRGDGVVWWHSCVSPDATNVEVSGSHVGLAFNRKAYRAIAAALAADPAT
jgi:pimeloyl-ACP methyl ester carboxylesterase